jgi:hypothetical protein
VDAETRGELSPDKSNPEPNGHILRAQIENMKYRTITGTIEYFDSFLLRTRSTNKVIKLIIGEEPLSNVFE